ncbi:MAG TPA: ATP-binding protein [Cyclobacteriaceae bacterium]|nr:ATP-binding protein [Cyclobacteriaceae bacterium]
MPNTVKKQLGATEKLIEENRELRQQLREARESIEAIKTGSIDALVVGDKKDLKVYTENTADKIYRILIEKMHEGAVTLNGEGTILYCNSYFARMVNLPLQKVIGTKFGKFICDPSSKEAFEVLLELGWKRNSQNELCVRASDGSDVPVQMSVNPLSLDDDLVLSIILTDLTIKNKTQEELKLKSRQLERMNVELEHANKDLTTFTYISSHDLQEPLRKIQNFVAMIFKGDEKNLSDTGKMYFRRVNEAAKRMQTLIDDLLTYARAKNVEREFEKTDLNIVVEEVKKEYEEAFQEMNVTVEAAHLGEASIIPFQFRQVIHNLISNSLKFSKPGAAPRVTIKSEIAKGSELNKEEPALPAGGLSSTTDYCHISYADNGIGFDPQYNERIFEVFQRLHNREEYKGTGMGLAICKRIIENHNGIITASGTLNEGARFDIYIPAA